MKLKICIGCVLLAVISGCQSLATETPEYSENTQEEGVKAVTFDRYGSFMVDAGTAEQPLKMRIWYSQPDRVTPDTPVVMVMHGGRRNADDYRDFWGAYARKYGALIVAPEVTQKAFPTGWGYQTGNWVTSDSSSTDASKGRRNPPQESSFAAVDRAFDGIRKQFGLNTDQYDIWGHGSGAQFVTRMITFYPQARVRTAVAANSGTYTFPDWRLPLRYGLKNTGIEPEDLKAAYAHHLVIMLGTADNDSSHRLLSKLDIARAQGAHRLEKGRNFYQANKAQAEKLGVDYNWELRTVYGIGHSGEKMSEPGARYLLAGKAEEALFSKDGKPADQDPSRDTGEKADARRLLRSSDDGEQSPF